MRACGRVTPDSVLKLEMMNSWRSEGGAFGFGAASCARTEWTEGNRTSKRSRRFIRESSEMDFGLSLLNLGGVYLSTGFLGDCRGGKKIHHRGRRGRGERKDRAPI